MRIVGLVKRIMLERFRDKRTLALLLIAPLLILFFMHLVFGSSESSPKLGTVGVEASVIDDFKSNNVDIVKYSNQKAKDIDLMKKDQLDGLLIKEGNNIYLHLKNENLGVSKQLEIMTNQVYADKVQQSFMTEVKAKVEDLTRKLDNLPFSPTKSIQFDSPEPPDVKTSYMYGTSDTSMFDIVSPILIGFFVFLFVILISSIGFLQERTSGTLERMLMTPIKRFEVVISYIIGFGLLAALQVIVIVTFAVYVLKIAQPESIMHIIIVNLIIALVALSLGLLLSSFAKSEFQLIQFILLVVVPQIFLSGIFRIDMMVGWLQLLSKFMPLYYAGDALQNIMYKGQNLYDVWLDLLVLILFSIIFIVLNVLALKRYRRI